LDSVALLAWWVSLPPREVEGPRISEAQARKLRLIARRTWRYFERFAGTESHGLPADNFQEVPQPEVARRTSPTNIGLSLLSTVAASDFGWIGTGEMVQRLEATFAALTKLERHRGHLFNWYDPEPFAAGAPLRVHGRQRQSRRAPDRAPESVPGAPE
jgi:cyclic beta-1,2-glucan synthetase